VLLDPVIYFQFNGVFQFLANFRENSLVHSRTNASVFRSNLVADRS
jgi:hypothetical protein